MYSLVLTGLFPTPERNTVRTLLTGLSAGYLVELRSPLEEPSCLCGEQNVSKMLPGK